MNSRSDDPVTDDEVSLGWLIKSLAYGFVDSLRRNKVATVLATLTLVILIVLAADSQFDGLPRYRELIFPRLSRLEAVFHTNLQSAGNVSGEWRRYYFENAHRQVKDILRAARLDRPTSYVARQKHREFIRYHELLDLEFNTIRKQMSVNPDFDYLSELTARIEELKPIRDVWAQWAEAQR